MKLDKFGMHTLIFMLLKKKKKNVIVDNYFESLKLRLGKKSEELKIKHFKRFGNVLNLCDE